jgi:hypothetical protein
MIPINSINLHLTIDHRIRELEALTRLTLRPGQVQALQSLAEGKDVVLAAKTGYHRKDADFYRLRFLDATNN